jgi:hypothetical protein
MSEHRQFGAGCTGCDWVSTDPRKSLRVDHAEHVAAVTEPPTQRIAAIPVPDSTWQQVRDGLRAAAAEPPTLAGVIAAHRLTFWAVYPWNGGMEVAPRCTCGVLWSAHAKDDPTRQVAAWEAHLAAVIEQHWAEEIA